MLEAALPDWTDTVTGGLAGTAWTPSENSSQFQFQQHLNAMVMSYTSDSTIHSPSGELFSCLIPQTEVQAWVWAITGFEIIVAIVLLVLGLRYRWRIRYLNEVERGHIKHMPNDIVSLQLAAIRGAMSDKDASIMPKSFHDYSFGWDKQDNFPVFERNEYFVSAFTTSLGHQIARMLMVD